MRELLAAGRAEIEVELGNGDLALGLTDEAGVIAQADQRASDRSRAAAPRQSTT